FRAGRARGQPRGEDTPGARHPGNRTAQPCTRGRSAPLLHALLGQRRFGQARPGNKSRARADQQQKGGGDEITRGGLAVWALIDFTAASAIVAAGELQVFRTYNVRVGHSQATHSRRWPHAERDNNGSREALPTFVGAVYKAWR